MKQGYLTVVECIEVRMPAQVTVRRVRPPSAEIPRLCDGDQPRVSRSQADPTGEAMDSRLIFLHTHSFRWGDGARPSILLDWCWSYEVLSR